MSPSVRISLIFASLGIVQRAANGSRSANSGGKFGLWRCSNPCRRRDLAIRSYSFLYGTDAWAIMCRGRWVSIIGSLGLWLLSGRPSQLLRSSLGIFLQFWRARNYSNELLPRRTNGETRSGYQAFSARSCKIRWYCSLFGQKNWAKTRRSGSFPDLFIP
jgi:hypothetical protein